MIAYRQAVDAMEALGGGILVTHHIQIPEPEEPLHVEKRTAFLDNLRTVAEYAAPERYPSRWKTCRVAIPASPRASSNL